MPRDGSGVFSPPAGTLATSGTAIESAKYNAFVNDLTADANAARPIVAGGTGATTAAAARTALGVQASSAALTSIAALTTAADRMIYTTAADTYAVATLTAAGRALLDDADAAAQLTTLGIGSDIPAVEALSGTGIAVRTGSSTWATRTITAGSGISITNGDGALGDIVVTATGGGTVTDDMLDTGAATPAGTTWVGLRVADLAAGAVGSYAYLRHATNNTALTAGTTYAGSDLRYSGVTGTTGVNVSTGATPSGTWRAMGTAQAVSGQQSSTLFLRIS